MVKKCIVYILGVIWILGFIVSGKYAFNYIYNQIITTKYNDGEYDVDTKPLGTCNVFEPHIVYYNTGNVYYQQGDYEEAEEEYREALTYDMSQDEECSVRINLALSMVYGLGDDYAAPEKIDSSIAKLKEARGVLMDKGCASDNGDGHNDTSQKLKEEIDKMIEELEQQKQSSGQSNQDPQNNQNNNSSNQEDAREDEIIEALQQNQADALQEREDNMELNEEFDINTDYDYGGTIW